MIECPKCKTDTGIVSMKSVGIVDSKGTVVDGKFEADTITIEKELEILYKCKCGQLMLEEDIKPVDGKVESTITIEV